MPPVLPFLQIANLTAKNIGLGHKLMTMIPDNLNLSMTSHALTGHLSSPTASRPFAIVSIHRVRNISSSLATSSTIQIRKYTGPKHFISNITFPGGTTTPTSPTAVQRIADFAVPFFTVLLMLLVVTALVGLALKIPDWANVNKRRHNAMPVLPIRKNCGRWSTSARSSLASNRHGGRGKPHRFAYDIDIEASRVMARGRDSLRDDESYDSEAPALMDPSMPNYGAGDGSVRVLW